MITVITTNNSESISKVMNVCIVIESLVRYFIKTKIWATNICITNNTIKHMKLYNRINQKSIENILSRYKRNGNLDNLEHRKFWKKYRPTTVQLEINVMKMKCTYSLKETKMIGKSMFLNFYYY